MECSWTDNSLQGSFKYKLIHQIDALNVVALTIIAVLLQIHYSASSILASAP